ncbi:helix-turn-helix domain-containing protein [Geoalkalibacter sp.]|uniref:helix-turn-helix domain-containing protein n=1 Tax=Geoalkalibacter sp. TaxID=3041440 RepID=UPI00272DD17D|nr:helix-turn-helix transcriptional regulator [Geoalkalibacter sp.]
MLEPTKKRLTKTQRVPLCFLVDPANVEKIRKLVAKIDPEAETSSPVNADTFFARNFPGQDRAAVHLKGLRYREDLTQAQLAARTGIPQRHISEMENGKRGIGRNNARKLAAALNADYRLFL